MGTLKFTRSHEWVRIDDGLAVVGITHHAQEMLGDIVFIELPRVGERVKQFSQFGTIESTKAASELYAPLSGEVIEINNSLIDNPQWINESPWDKGWMIKLKVEDSKELDNLMDEASYKEFVAKEK
jgi:glycine cleavage system H protein